MGHRPNNGVCCGTSRTAARPLWVGTSNSVTIAVTNESPTTPAATGTVPSARDRPAPAGCGPGRRSCCPCRTFTWSSPCRRRSARWPSRTRRSVYDVLFRAVGETLLEVAANPKRLGARIGFLAVLHTWGQNLMHHPHIHCVVPAGGLSPDGAAWVPGREDFFLPGPGAQPRLPRQVHRLPEAGDQPRRTGVPRQPGPIGRSRGNGTSPGSGGPSTTGWCMPSGLSAGRKRSEVPGPLHAPRGDLQPAVAAAGEWPGHLLLEGLCPWQPSRAR